MVVEAPSRKDEVLDRIVDYVFEHGVSDLSLRPLAEALGTSPRMLLYHFDSKERLVVEVLAAARSRQYEMLTSWVEVGAGLPEVVGGYWNWAADEANRPYMRLFFEVFGLAVQRRPGTEGVLEALSEQAETFFQRAAQVSGLEPGPAAHIARMAVAFLRGLLFSLLASDDRPPLDAAMRDFLDYLNVEIASRRTTHAR